jgi:hypothetical protein
VAFHAGTGLFSKNGARTWRREQYLIALACVLFLYIGLCSANPK